MSCRNYLYLNIDKGKYSGVVLIDLKAFDAVDPSLLLEKFEKYGIKGLELNWFTSYLQGKAILYS